jgi:hypothetical protein
MPTAKRQVKLRYLGMVVRRRPLYVLTLSFAIANVPTVSWAILALGHSGSHLQMGLFVAAGLVTLWQTARGWKIIQDNALILYWEEGRLIWPLAILALGAVMYLACTGALYFFGHSLTSLLVPLLLGLLLLAPLALRVLTLELLPKKEEMWRGEEE